MTSVGTSDYHYQCHSGELCHARNKDGAKCRRYLCERFPYCYQHSRIIQGLDIMPSRIPRGGKGLFAFKSFRRNEVILEYSGKLIKNSHLIGTPHATSRYLLQVSPGPDGYTIDAASPRTSLARYANDCRASNTRVCRGNNARFAVTGKRGFLVADKAVEVGDEITVAYGAPYWEFFGEPH